MFGGPSLTVYAKSLFLQPATPAGQLCVPVFERPNVITFDGLKNNDVVSAESQVKESLIDHVNDGLDPHLVAASFAIGDVDL